MKKLVLTVTLSMACIGAFAQGKIAFSTDTLHLVYFTTDTTHLAPGDTALAGRGLYKKNVTTLAGAPALAVDLYAGTTSSSLSLISSTGFNTSIGEGKWTSANVLFPTATGFAAGSTVFAQVNIHDSRDLTADASSKVMGHYYGTSDIFSFVLQAAYNPITQTAAPVSSTWATGSYDLSVIGAGQKGAILMQANIPEPTSLALAGLSVAALLAFRRRN